MGLDLPWTDEVCRPKPDDLGVDYHLKADSHRATFLSVWIGEWPTRSKKEKRDRKGRVEV
jgi:hypothetical protein